MLTNLTPAAATLTLHLAGLQPSLLAASGLPKSVASALVPEVLPLLLRALGNPDQLGSSATVWALCQKLYGAEAHVSLPALMREDEGWPAQRRQLAETLLGTAGLQALCQRHSRKASPDLVAQLAGRLGSVLLATAGQYSCSRSLNENELRNWLRTQNPAATPVATPAAKPAAPTPVAAELPAPVPELKSAPKSKSAPEPKSAPKPELTMAAVADDAQAGPPAWRQQLSKWWSLTGLALAAAGAGGYYLSRPAAPATALVAQQPEPRPVAETAGSQPPPLLAVAAVSSVGPVVASEPALASTPASTPASIPASTSASAEKSRRLVKAVVKTEKKSKKSKLIAERGRHKPQHAQVKSVAAEPTNPGDEQLYKRLAQPDPASRQLLDLDHLTFEQGQTTLDAEGVRRLKKVAALLRKFPRNHLIVFGNAEPAEPQPLLLALSRAQVVVTELLKQGAPTGVLQAQGRMRPVANAANDPASGRRIALYVSPPPPPPAD